MRTCSAVMRLLAVALLALSARAANATYNAGYFDNHKQPSVLFDKKTLTWTIRNQAVERILHFDTAAGTLQTVSLRDVRRNVSLALDPKAEGAIDFAAPIAGTPEPLNAGWVGTTAEPSSAWISPSFDAASWSKEAGALGEGWHRMKFAAGQVKIDRALSLVLDTRSRGSIEVWIDGIRTTSTNGEAGVRELDLPSTAALVAVHVGRGGRARLMLAEVGTSPTNLDLSADWHYNLYAINYGDGGSRVLTISLSGLKRYEGFDVDVNYQVFPGDEPFLLKWFAFNSHRRTRFLIENVAFDRILPSAGSVDPPDSRPRRCWSSSDRSGDGFVAAVNSPLGACANEPGSTAITLTARPYYPVVPDYAQVTPREFIGLYHGSAAAGCFLYQLFRGEYVCAGGPATTPNSYATGLGYGANIDAATCERIIPLAAALGVQAFVLDDGWETNVMPDTGRLGDWIVDAARFPNGLAPISTLARERGMKFGIWADPVRVNSLSQAHVAHPDWERGYDITTSKSVPDVNGMVDLCPSCVWGTTFTESIAQLCRAVSASFVKLSVGAQLGVCFSLTHDHPVGHAESNDLTEWQALIDRLRKLDAKAVVTAIGANERGPWNGQDSSNATGPERWPAATEDRAAWRTAISNARADALRAAATEPTFALTQVAPCSVGTSDTSPQERLRSLEYGLTSAAALSGSIELQGNLDAMTADERALTQRWVRWNLENRPWLANSQPLAGIDGVLHLRPALEGRFGYVAVWNGGTSAITEEISFRPGDCFVKLDSSAIEIRRIRDNTVVKHAGKGDAISLGAISIDRFGWEIFEIRQRGK